MCQMVQRLRGIEVLEGLLLYNGQQEDGSGDFISVGLTNGYVEFRFELGSGVGYLRSHQPVQMDTWPLFRSAEKRRTSEVTGTSQGRMMGLDLTQPLFVGSVPSFDKISRDNGYNIGFVEVSIVEPAFDDDAFAAYPTPKSSQNSLKVHMKIKPNNLDDCLLVYCAQYLTRKETLPPLESAWKCPAIIRHPERLRANEWITLSASRRAQNGELVVNDGHREVGRSPGHTQGVNLNTPMYVGGVDKTKVTVHPDAGVSHGFEGCVAHIEVNDVSVDLIGAVVDAANVDDCGGRAPCEKNPCQNHGICRERGPKADDFECFCKAGYSGRTCENQDDFCQKINPCHNNAECVGLANSYSYEMGGGPAEIVSEERVDDGQLHAVELRRTGKRGTLKIDNKEVHGESLGLLVMLNTKGDIFIVHAHLHLGANRNGRAHDMDRFAGSPEDTQHRHIAHQSTVVGLPSSLGKQHGVFKHHFIDILRGPINNWVAGKMENTCLKLLFVYLDYNATAPVEEEVQKSIIYALQVAWGNPTSNHDGGTEARRIIDEARMSVANMIGASPPEIVFTSGGTESNNMIIHSLVRHFRKTRSSFAPLSNCKIPHVITSNIEHNSILLTLKDLCEDEHIDLTVVPVSKVTGTVSAEEVITAIRPNTCFVTIMLANNETGIIQPVNTIGTLLKDVNQQRKKHSLPEVLFHTDAAQALGKVAVNVDDLKVDYLTIAGHKFYGPRTGALYFRDSKPLYPLLFGAGQERGLRPGDSLFAVVEPSPDKMQYEQNS
ncbi:hypothetical protein HPB52_024993 [Rhipicephalus sanguineus]|uniref:Selenocysteine lyase n=1 Tax=Rhipicephalus sanguineus TaxID=34632 RepID=A0A9D4TDJ2_RHISA|nr:hypothetical protein HPB52_024993 [Rhipicephalus sanguineus]